MLNIKQTQKQLVKESLARLQNDDVTITNTIHKK